MREMKRRTQALFKALTDAGLDTCFANPGTSEMQLVYEMGRVKDTRAILCLEENVVTGAADETVAAGGALADEAPEGEVTPPAVPGTAAVGAPAPAPAVAPVTGMVDTAPWPQPARAPASTRTTRSRTARPGERLSGDRLAGDRASIRWAGIPVMVAPACIPSPDRRGPGG